MSENGAKASTRTVLALGRVRAEVALYKTTAEKKANEGIEKRSPRGKPLQTPARARGSSGALLFEAETAEVVAPDEVRRGIVRPEGFVDLTEALAEIDERTKLEEMRVVGFVDYRHVPAERIVGSYWLGAGGPGAPRVLALLRAAMLGAGRVAIVKWTKRTRQALGILRPRGDALLVLELAFADDRVEPPPAATTFSAAKVVEAEVTAAQRLIHALAATRETLDDLRDDRDVLREALFASVDEGTEADFEVAAEPDADLIEELAAVASS